MRQSQAHNERLHRMQEDHKEEFERIRAQHHRENEALEGKLTAANKERNNDKKEVSKLQQKINLQEQDMKIHLNEISKLKIEKQE